MMFGILLLLGIGAGVFAWSGGFDRLLESRVESSLTDAGVPNRLAACMAPKMVERLSLSQLRDLQMAIPQDAASVPVVLDRLQKSEDREAFEVVLLASGQCAIGSALGRD